MRLIPVRVLRPVLLFGRVAATYEQLRLDERDALPLLASGHVRRLDDLAEIVLPGAIPGTGGASSEAIAR